jgi:DivIVA domain-containing protein
MSEESPIVIGLKSKLDPDEIKSKEFNISKRGFDPTEVKAYLEDLSRNIQILLRRERELEEKIQELGKQKGSLEIDEESLTEQLGIEAARILSSARQSAKEIIDRAQSQSEEIIRQAEIVLAERSQEAEIAANEILDTAYKDQEKIKRESEQIKQETADQAKETAAKIVSEANEIRAAILNDLIKRRRLLRNQVGQLQAGRDAIMESIEKVKEQLNELYDRLENSDNDARYAAEQASIKVTLENDPTVDRLKEEARSAKNQLQGSLDEESKSGDSRSNKESGDVARESFMILGPVVSKDKTEVGQSELAKQNPISDKTPQESGKSVVSPVEHGAPKPDIEAIFTKLKSEQSVTSEPIKTKSAKKPKSKELESLDLTGFIAELSRNLKREISDSQNEAVSRLRKAGEEAQIHEVLSTLINSEKLKSTVIDTLLKVSELVTGVNDNIIDTEVELIAEQLVSGVISIISEGILKDGVSGLSSEDVIERVNTVFRFFRSNKADELSSDYVVAAYSVAQLNDAKGRAKVIWVPKDEHCPDCEDNFLAGAVTPGDSFPTGHIRPPAHTGCRCLLGIFNG